MRLMMTHTYYFYIVGIRRNYSELLGIVVSFLLYIALAVRAHYMRGPLKVTTLTQYENIHINQYNNSWTGKKNNSK